MMSRLGSGRTSRARAGISASGRLSAPGMWPSAKDSRGSTSTITAEPSASLEATSSRPTGALGERLAGMAPLPEDFVDGLDLDRDALDLLQIDRQIGGNASVAREHCRGGGPIARAFDFQHFRSQLMERATHFRSVHRPASGRRVPADGSLPPREIELDD